MKKLVVTALILTLPFTFFAQTFDFGLKGGVNYNFGGDLKEIISETGDNIQNIVTGADAKAGFHAGLWMRAHFMGLYLRPELIYTELKNGYVNSEVNSLDTDFKFKKIDVPIMLGANIAGPLHIYGGPALQYILKSDFSQDEFTNVKTDDFSVGLNFGAGLELGRLGVDVRWEKGFENELNADSTFPGTKINLDNRPNQLIFGITYRLNDRN